MNAVVHWTTETAEEMMKDTFLAYTVYIWDTP
jgi:hypothetical protein